ncbi:FUSC family protein [Amphibacillus jilinensis]|uniref:FUSC family protein n=1 Tax=Amphibacillus jilinensis TaxID=1216008 RepID=UPI00030F2A0A|nr:aromatic acid exporter family protein [Amphibacillus jilinensis]
MRHLLQSFIGSRIIKTGLAVFITSTICLSFNLPAVFAVITSIVTIEPTVSHSIKKGLTRFPASAIGSFYAVTFISLFGQSPITYSGAAILTIVTCSKLKLYDGLLVATLTSVAMVQVIEADFFIAFLSRLGTTSIGITVSTLVNFFVLPPNYLKQIDSAINMSLNTAAQELKLFSHALFKKNDRSQVLSQSEEIFEQFHYKISDIERLLSFQRAESQYHRQSERKKTKIESETKQLRLIKLIHYHIGNLNATLLTEVSWNEESIELVNQAVDTLASYIKDPRTFDRNNQYALLEKLHKRFSTLSLRRSTKQHYFHAETIILYELIALFQLTEKLADYHIKALAVTSKK